MKPAKKKPKKADDLSATQSLMARLAAMPHKPHSSDSPRAKKDAAKERAKGTKK